MKILITGGTGFIGRKLIEYLCLQGYENISVLSRNPEKAKHNSPFPLEFYHWDPDQNKIDLKALEQVDTIIHLAGENIADARWTRKKKDTIINSRINSTSLLINSLKKIKKLPSKLISASAIGIYGDGKEEILDEQTIPKGNSFLSETCKKWEDLVLNHSLKKMKSYVLRIGIVLDKNGGALKTMLPFFKLGIGGKLGKGHQYMSWIHIEDLIQQIVFLIENKCTFSIYNAVSPHPIKNQDFTQLLGSYLQRPTYFSVPSFALKSLFGEMSQILLKSQRVMPQNFMHEGYSFNFSNLKIALEDIFKYEGKKENVFTDFLWIQKPPEKVFEFFSNEMNLENITPPELKFKVLGKNTTSIEKGTLIDYQLKLYGFPFKWKTEISSFENNHSFVDQQLKGPYNKWIHTHTFYPFKSGTIMKDEVIYKIPLGIIGSTVAGKFVKKNVENIFKYRKETIEKIFS